MLSLNVIFRFVLTTLKLYKRLAFVLKLCLFISEFNYALNIFEK